VDALARLVRAPVNDAWVSDAVSLVEDAIGLLVDTFVSAPYLHRVEHSFHAELISEPRNIKSSAFPSKSGLQDSRPN
jgi:hypothetical protein